VKWTPSAGPPGPRPPKVKRRVAVLQQHLQLTNRSRDYLPNPLTGENPYVPLNSPPAIGDMMDLFNFER
jgi:hypothetical protein